jgi:serine/threonine protein kinase
LGNGAYGEVRKCVNKLTGTKRAVKIMKKNALDKKE